MAHIEEAAQSIAQISITHYRAADRFQRRIDRVTGWLEQPWCISVAALLILGWIGLNLLAGRLGFDPVDPAPFPGLGFVTSLASLCVMLVVLAAQRNENALAEKREQLTLQLAVLSERKTAKVIELLEEFRRDLPTVHNRIDKEAIAMAQPANPEKALEVIAETQAGIEQLRAAPGK